MKKAFILGAIAACAALVPSCANWANLGSVASTAVGASAEVYYGTVVSARSVRIDASSSEKNMGTGIGAAIGAGAGQLLGGGSGRIVSTVGFGALGALVGRGGTKYVAQSDGQELHVRIDKSNRTIRVTQPVYQGIGPIPVGTHGTLEIGSGTSKFLPDGY